MPESTSVVSARLVAPGRDTTVTVPYHSGGPIELGSLPAGTAFAVTMTGYKVLADGARKALWWTSGRDTARSEVLHTVYLDPLTAPAASSTLLPATPVYQGDTLVFPANVYVTTNGSDPRDSGVAVPAGPYAIDSIATLKAAIRYPADPTSGRIEDLWSAVQTFSFGIDPQDTITSLDTLVVSNERTLARNSSYLHQPPFHPDSLHVRDSIQIQSVDSLFLVASASSDRATLSLEGSPLADSVPTFVGGRSGAAFRITVENHGRTRTYTVVVAPYIESFSGKFLSGLAVTPGTFDCQHDTSCVAVVGAGTNSVDIGFGRSQGSIVQVQDSILESATSISVPLLSDLDTIRILSWTAQDPVPLRYTIHVFRSTGSGAFLDTTYGVPWRATTYDTVVDSRDGLKYRTVVVGTARWMAENLRYRVDSSWCNISNTDSCRKYGRVYRWSGAMDSSSHFDSASLPVTGFRRGICPSGWHLPTEAEWSRLVSAVAGERSSYLLRAAGAAWSDGAGLDTLGMRILPAGMRYFLDPPQVPYVYPTEVRSKAWFWSATEGSNPAKYAKSFSFSTSTTASGDSPKVEGLGVRCVADLPAAP